VAQLAILSRYFTAETEDNHENLCQDRLSAAKILTRLPNKKQRRHGCEFW
jgi:hypothetical protein